MPTPFEKWWENKGYFKAKERGLLGTVPDAVEIARLAYEEGLQTSPIVVEGKTLFEFKSHFIKCTCTCQQLECEVYDYKDGDSGVNFSIWSRGRDGKKLHSWKERIRWCWQILRTGMPWADDIIATNKDARELAVFILQNLPQEDRCPVCGSFGMKTHEENKKQ